MSRIRLINGTSNRLKLKDLKDPDTNAAVTDAVVKVTAYRAGSPPVAITQISNLTVPHVANGTYIVQAAVISESLRNDYKVVFTATSGSTVRVFTSEAEVVESD